MEQSINRNDKYEILTPAGWSNFTGVRKIKKPKTVSIYLSDGQHLECSENHPIKSKCGFIKSKDLEINDFVQTKDGSYSQISNIITDHFYNNFLYDALDVYKNNEYYTNGFVSHNCQFLGSSNTLIEGSKLKTLVDKTPIKEAQGISMYSEPEEGHLYACTVDVSRGKGLDYSAFQIIDVTEMPYKQVCVFRDNFVTPVEYAEIIYRTATLYNEATCLIEINDIGEQVSELLHFDFEYENILFTESAGRAGRRISAGFNKGVDKGIRTTKTVKSVGCSILKLLIEQDQLILNDHNTINELSRFSRKGASYEAEPGSHDDLVMCLVLFAWLSNQAYFKDITDIQTLSRLRERTEEELMNDLLPFGIHDDGIDEEEIIEIPQHNDWMMNEEDRFF